MYRRINELPDKDVCPGCAAGAPKTYDGYHHPNFNGRRYYTCRAAAKRRRDAKEAL